MKNNFKNEIISLLNGEREKIEILVIDTFGCQPGFFRYNRKLISASELSDLKNDFVNIVIFTLAKNKIRP